MEMAVQTAATRFVDEPRWVCDDCLSQTHLGSSSSFSSSSIWVLLLLWVPIGTHCLHQGSTWSGFAMNANQSFFLTHFPTVATVAGASSSNDRSLFLSIGRRDEPRPLSGLQSRAHNGLGPDLEPRSRLGSILEPSRSTVGILGYQTQKMKLSSSGFQTHISGGGERERGVLGQSLHLPPSPPLVTVVVTLSRCHCFPTFGFSSSYSSFSLSLSHLGSNEPRFGDGGGGWPAAQSLAPTNLIFKIFNF